LPIARFFNITADFLLDNDIIIQKNDECEKSERNNSVEIKMMTPAGDDDFEKIQEIADYIKNSNAVILNLEKTSEEMKVRYLDFLRGVTYSIGGTAKRVSTDTYILSPDNVKPISKDECKNI